MGHLNGIGVPPKRRWRNLSTKKKLIKLSLSDEAIAKFEWLASEDKKKSTKRHYKSQTFERLIENEYKIRKAFGR